MYILFALSLAALATSQSSGAAMQKAERCTANQPSIARDNGTARFRRLDQLPPANLHLAVLRQVDGCTKPTIIRHNVGGRR